MSALEFIAWRLIWWSHWLNGHQTMDLRDDPDSVWCIDCLRVRRKPRHQRVLL